MLAMLCCGQRFRVCDRRCVCAMWCWQPGDACVQCGAGSQPNADATACESCLSQTDSFWYSADGSPCIRCEAGQEPNTQRTGCDACVGQYSSDGRECVDCEPGYEPSSVSGAIGCTSCSDFGTMHISNTGRQCGACDAGKQPNEARHECIDCGEGEYSDGSLCQPCPTGSQPKVDQSGCDLCLALGTNLYSADGASCIGCGAGSTLGVCQACAGGTVVNADHTACDDVSQSASITDISIVVETLAASNFVPKATLLANFENAYAILDIDSPVRDSFVQGLVRDLATSLAVEVSSIVISGIRLLSASAVVEPLHYSG
eukprot:COSAG06_NODE_12820_length_1324_cov_5.426122_2_plen_316_part_00